MDNVSIMRLGLIVLLLAAFFLLVSELSAVPAGQADVQGIPSWEVHDVLETARQITMEAAS